MAKLKVTEVFTPGAFPNHTYVEREEKKLESSLADALATPGQIVSLSGPSKSGKTVLVEHVVGLENLITITGAGLQAADDLWDKILDWMDVPSESSRTGSLSGGVEIGVKASGSSGIPGIVKGKVGGTVEGHVEGSKSKSTVHQRRGLPQVLHEIADSDFVVLLDDFHYMPRGVQTEVAKQIKEAARQGVKIITASVRHRSDDVVRANPELRGRVLALDLDYWEDHSLLAIADQGFSKLSVEVDRNTLDHFVREAAGSPQLMQAICLNTCFEIGVREARDEVESVSIPIEQRRSIFERTSTTTDFRSLVDVLECGPKTRGTERKLYTFADKTEGDVYRCILKALASDPPTLSCTYDQVLQRVHAICVGEHPVGSSIQGSCHHMGKLAVEKFPQERVIDWDENTQVLDIADPYLLFYLRWSGRLDETS